MKNAKSIFIALLAAALIFAGNLVSQAQSPQQATDRTNTDSSTTKNTGKKNADVAPAQKKNSSKKPTASTASTSPATAPKDAPGSTAPASDPPMAGQKALSVSTSRIFWVNTESGKPGTRWYGKTKQGKYMTEADAIKAGYHPAKKE